jgi:hypothetical protein
MGSGDLAATCLVTGHVLFLGGGSICRVTAPIRSYSANYWRMRARGCKSIHRSPFHRQDPASEWIDSWSTNGYRPVAEIC